MTTVPMSDEVDQELARIRELRSIWQRDWVDQERKPLSRLLKDLGKSEIWQNPEAESDFAKVSIEVQLPISTPDLHRPLQLLHSLTWSVDMIERAMTDLVRESRRRGRSWAEIGEALRVTRQSAWAKYASLDE